MMTVEHTIKGGVMKKRLSIKELLHNSWKSFIDNGSHWIFLFGMQLVSILSFLLCCSILLALIHYFFIDLLKRFLI